VDATLFSLPRAALSIAGSTTPLLIPLLQIGVILATARVVGLIFRRIHQLQVVGEMAAGILLGPSLLGRIAPQAWTALFAPASLGFIGLLSQVGLVLFMFLVGLEIDPQVLRKRSWAALAISYSGIVLPFLMGVLLSLYLYPRLGDGGVTYTHFALFVGTAMSITAFPVLARILVETGLVRTPLGTVTLASAAADDVAAWCILAGVVVLVRADAAIGSPALMLLGLAAYAGVMLFGMRRALRGLEAIYRRHGRLGQGLLAFLLLLVLASAGVTEWLGLHALFGAFLMGAVLPKERGFVRAIAERLEDVTAVLLLPLFFAFTGLRTRIDLVSGAGMWLLCALIIVVAVAGKLGGASLAARLAGMTWREAGALGVLMNTRGLMELVILNIGLDIGIISPTLFAMMVLMALTTTFMTVPLLEWIYPVRLRGREPAAARVARAV